MRFIEYGTLHTEIMLLIHGMQVPWQLWTDHIEHFSAKYHVVVPVLSGHNPEEKSTFLSIQEEARTIEDFILQNYRGEVSIICGISLGGAISALLWERGKIHINQLFLDGAPLVPYHFLMSSLIEKQYQSISLKTQQRDVKTLSACEKSFIPAKYMNCFLAMIDAMSAETIGNCVNSIRHFQLSQNCDAKSTKVVYYYGTKVNEHYSKKSAKYLRRYYPKVTLHCLQGQGHCELFLFSPNQHIHAIEKFLM